MTDDALTIIEYCTKQITIHGDHIRFGLTDLQRELGMTDDQIKAAFGELFEAGLCNFIPGPDQSWNLVLLPGNTAEAIWEGSNDVT